MDCDEVKGVQSSDWSGWTFAGKGNGVMSPGGGWSWPQRDIQEVGEPCNQWTPLEDVWSWDINALGKGKAAMKGWKGAPGAVGKGGGFQGACYNCGEVGHPAKECPKGKGKGGGKSGCFGKAEDKGQGKGRVGFQGFCSGCGGSCPSLDLCFFLS